LGVGRRFHILNDEFVFLRSAGHSRDIDRRAAAGLDKAEHGLDTVMLVVGRLHLQCNLLFTRIDKLVSRGAAARRKRADGRVGSERHYRFRMR
ncbi:hypothetical protein PFISCL1PPCAC_11063, partial [Pristionchus fissidentatus]